TVDRARADLARVQSQLAEQYPNSDRRIRASVEPLKEVTIGGMRTSLWLVYGAGWPLLLITGTNIAAPLLSRGAQRQHENALRLSLGAAGGGGAARVMAESAVLAVAGGGLGLALGVAAAKALRTAAADLPRMDEIAIDGRILFYTFVTTGVVA